MQNNATIKVKGISNLSLHQLQDEVARGGRFVSYSYCLSFFLASFKKRSDVYFLKRGENAFVKSLPWTLTTLLFGWWSIPSGFQNSCSTLIINLTGGRNLTDEVMMKIFIKSGGPAFEFENESKSEKKLDKIKLTI
jgi:hypothetical protein